MSTFAQHKAKADEALDAAKALRETHPAWALVPLFYSAMHLLHAQFDAQQLAPGERHPGKHSGHASSPGTNDVVRTRFPHVDGQYRHLVTGAHVVRYGDSLLKGDGARFWNAYAELTRRL